MNGWPRRLFSFPNPVNELAARTVAAGVFVMAVVTTATGWGWLLIPMAYGFWARVLTGPTLSPLGLLATRVVAPALPLPPRPTPGPPKRFAQGIGTVLSTGSLVAWALGAWPVAVGLLALVAGAALLESAFGYCLGCKVFALLMRLGLIPQSVCEECADLALRHPRLARHVAT